MVGKGVYMKNTKININSVCDILTEMLNIGVTIEKGCDA